MSPPPQWKCERCGRTLDDHQLRGTTGVWFDRPMCVEKGAITKGLRFGGTPT